MKYVFFLIVVMIMSMDGMQRTMTKEELLKQFVFSTNSLKAILTRYAPVPSLVLQSDLCKRDGDNRFCNVCVSSDEKRVASSQGKTIWVFDVSDGQCKNVFTELEPIVTMQFGSGSQLLANATQKNKVNIWDCVENKKIQTIKYNDYVYKIIVTPHNHFVISFFLYKAQICVNNIHDGSCAFILDRSHVYQTDFSVDGQYMRMLIAGSQPLIYDMKGNNIDSKDTLSRSIKFDQKQEAFFMQHVLGIISCKDNIETNTCGACHLRNFESKEHGAIEDCDRQGKVLVTMHKKAVLLWDLSHFQKIFELNEPELNAMHDTIKQRFAEFQGALVKELLSVQQDT